ncbi:MAG TPA: sensor histidine kinase [Tepidisphaeraceae bacterium]|jgi:signal transduction histidine kinase
MRLGIRGKLVGTLLLAGLLPLALALGVILFGVVELRIQSRGRVCRALATQQANHLSSILAAQVELANLINGLPGTVEFLEKANRVPPLTEDQIKRIEDSWPALRENQGILAQILNNELAARWTSVARARPRFTEVMITDATGRLVAATDKTSDFFQADEEWWQSCWNGGQGRTLISDVIFDKSAIPPDGGPPGALVADLCLPIYDHPGGDGAAAPPRKVVGIAKISLDATWMLRQVDVGVGGDEVPRAAWLVRSDGRAVNGAAAAGAAMRPPAEVLPPKIVRRLTEQASGWVKDDELPGYELVGFARVEQSRMIEQAAARWHVMVASSVHETVATVYQLAWVILGLGLAVIAGCFLGGLVIARRGIVRPVLKLEKAVNQITRGNLDYRLSEARGRGEVFRDDEIGRLARDFNVMADQLKQHVADLERADELKRQFIDLASHELRTPVTYILGASQLAQRQQNGNASPILGKVSAKAQRLNRIVENMFKLLASDRFERGLRLADVDVAGLIEAVRQEHEPFLKERKQHWRIEVTPDLPHVHADADKVRDILGNLVSNVIRFSPDGGEVGIRAAPAPDGDGIRITVSDGGPGIPPQDLPHLFQPFYTGGEDAVARHSSGDYQHMSRGMGLGLSVVKRFVELHGGRVSVDTSAGGGTRIHVFLPARPAAEPDAENGKPPRQTSGQPGNA